jgi:hypothetical protein
VLPGSAGPAAGEVAGDLGGQRPGQLDQLVVARPPEVAPVQGEQPAELGDGGGVVVDPQVDVAVGAAAVAAALPDHQQRGRLLAAGVAPGGLAGVERGDQPLGELEPGPLAHGRRHRLDGRAGHQDVALAGEAVAGAVAGPVGALAAGVGGHAAGGVDDRGLALARLVVGAEQGIEGLARRGAGLQQGEPARAVGDVGPRLGGDHAGPRPPVEHDAADAQELRLHRAAEVAGLRVPGDDREGHRWPPVRTRPRPGAVRRARPRR